MAVVLVALICATRLYLGVHCPSDVLGGIVVGLAWAGFCMATLEASLVLARRRARSRAWLTKLPAPRGAECAPWSRRRQRRMRRRSSGRTASPSG